MGKEATAKPREEEETDLTQNCSDEEVQQSVQEVKQAASKVRNSVYIQIVSESASFMKNAPRVVSARTFCFLILSLFHTSITLESIFYIVSAF